MTAQTHPTSRLQRRPEPTAGTAVVQALVVFPSATGRPRVAEIAAVMSLCSVGIGRSLNVLMRTPRLPGSEPVAQARCPWPRTSEEASRD